MNIQFDNLFRISEEHGIKKEDFSSTNSIIEERLAGINNRCQGFYGIVDNEEVLDEIEEYTKKVEGKYSHIVVLGIGGSANGMLCLQQSLHHQYRNSIKDNKKPGLFVINNIDPAMIREIEDVLELSKTLFVVVSKSGTTSEPMSVYLYFRKKIDEANLQAREHFVFVTDSEKGVLNEIIKKDDIKKFVIPENVGGRFSVLTPVGLLPASLTGIDIRELISGAKDMRDRFLSVKFDENLPYQLALAQYLLYRKGKSINVIMPYSVKLDRFGDWFMQLIAESTGKAKNNYGEIINVGITPTKAIGTTDQHIQTQLFNEGPNNKLIMVVEVRDQDREMVVPTVHEDVEKLSIYQNVKFKDLYDIARKANVEVFTKNNRPNLTISIDKVDEYSIGELFMLFEGATAFLGEFFEINVFDQPGVELSKVLTKEGLVNLKKNEE